MNKRELKKERLDLEYHGETQSANAFLILLTTGILGFMGTFMWRMEHKLFLYGVAITLTVSLIGSFLYRRSVKRMKDILDEIENI